MRYVIVVAALLATGCGTALSEGAVAEVKALDARCEKYTPLVKGVRAELGGHLNEFSPETQAKLMVIDSEVVQPLAELCRVIRKAVDTGVLERGYSTDGIKDALFAVLFQSIELAVAAKKAGVF